ncbi:MAG: DcrB-related protein [Deltaproteobacteria bacterium]|nr:DcrB-related protein [Deltaproteobacteria bacterium]
MPKIDLAGLEVTLPENWQIQGMVTLTLPSPDPKVKPNIILTREKLPQPMTLDVYFQKIKEAISRRGIKDFKVLQENRMTVGGVPAIQMICVWDVGAMKAMMGPSSGPPPPKNQPPQLVKQIQVTLLREDMTAVNLTASFPSDQFDLYNRPFQTFLKTLKFQET